MHSTYCFIIIFIFVVSCINCWNFTENLLKYKKGFFNTRHGRLISFDTSDEFLKLDLDFTVPFIEVPVKRSMEYAKNFVAKINLPALLFAGLMIFVSAVVIPTIFMFWGKKLHLKDPFSSNETNSTYKSLEDQPVLWQYIAYIDTFFLENNIDTTSCLQKSMCSLVKKSKMDVLTGHGSSISKIVDGVSSNEWFLEQILNTPFYSAVTDGTNNVLCSERYNQCKITQKKIYKLATEIIRFVGT